MLVAHSEEIIQDVVDVNSQFDMYFLIIRDASMYKNTIYSTCANPYPEMSEV